MRTLCFALCSFLCSLLFAPTLLLGQNADVPAVPQFVDDDRVVFLGNSITQGGTFHTFVNLFYLTRFPERKIVMANSGIAGNQAYHAIARFEKDVLNHDPDIIVMMFGMNDAGMRADSNKTDAENKATLQKKIDIYRNNMDSLTNIILGEGIELIYIAPSIYDDKVQVDGEIRYGGNEAIAMCRDVVYDLAAKYHCPVVDFFTIMNEVNAKYQKDDPTFTVVGADRVHPGEEGHLLMAYQFLKAQNVPSAVANIHIDAASLKVQEQENCTVSNLNKSGDLLFFAVKAQSLPFPMLGNAATEWVPFQEELNQEMLQVTGLAEGNYALTIGSVELGEFSHEALAKGINLANYAQTPQYQQALQLKKLAMTQQEMIKSKIRAMKLLEFGILQDLPDTASLEEKKAVFIEHLKKIEQQNYYPYIKLQTENYLIYTPLNEETERAIEQYTQAMRLLNRPVTRKYLLAPVKGK